MLRLKTLRVLVLVALLAFATTSCTLKHTWDLIGKWQKVDSAETMEFTGSGVMKWGEGASSMAASYKVIDGKKLEINLGSFGIMCVDISADGNMLTVKDSAGKTASFKRVL